ncbi:hypothetical protein DCAR_0311176 [Daucus carota subsp. sativus]|uniref:Uncharacterized protein n=1 Tax=Daucus carota subsp. sativus TaxID=79200 RepID=A0A166AEY8_DAUCS|nr:hypothetical protein DCAR_0311176 [Daucus carota subsp. sativus]
MKASAWKTCKFRIQTLMAGTPGILPPLGQLSPFCNIFCDSELRPAPLEVPSPETACNGTGPSTCEGPNRYKWLVPHTSQWVYNMTPVVTFSHQTEEGNGKQNPSASNLKRCRENEKNRRLQSKSVQTNDRVEQHKNRRGVPLERSRSRVWAVVKPRLSQQHLRFWEPSAAIQICARWS